MKAPLCPLCGGEHWSYQPHTFVGEEVMRNAGLDPNRSERPDVMTGVAHPVKREVTTKLRPEIRPEIRPENASRPEIPTNKRTRGRPKKWTSEAERKRAARERRG